MLTTARPDARNVLQIRNLPQLAFSISANLDRQGQLGPRLTGSFLVRDVMNHKATSRIAIFLPNWVGDVVMATPALRAIRQHFGQRAEIIGVMRQHVQDVLSGSDLIDQVILYDRRTPDVRQHCLSVVRELRRRQIDEVLLLTNSFRAAAMAWLSGVRKRIGYARYGRGYLLNHRLHPPRAALELLPVSPVDYYLNIAAAVGAAPADRQPRLATDEDDEQAAELVWERFGWDRFEPVVAMNTGGAYGVAKRWPNQHFAQLALRIVSDRLAKVLVICGPAERDAARDIVRRSGAILTCRVWRKRDLASDSAKPAFVAVTCW